MGSNRHMWNMKTHHGSYHDWRALLAMAIGADGLLFWLREAASHPDETSYRQYHEPQAVIGRLRAHGLLIEAAVDEKLPVSIPVALRKQPWLMEID